MGVAAEMQKRVPHETRRRASAVFEGRQSRRRAQGDQSQQGMAGWSIPVAGPSGLGGMGSFVSQCLVRLGAMFMMLFAEGRQRNVSAC